MAIPQIPLGNWVAGGQKQYMVSWPIFEREGETEFWLRFRPSLVLCGVLSVLFYMYPSTHLPTPGPAQGSLGVVP